MSAGPHTIGREQSLAAAKQLMHKSHVRHLPVLHGGKLVGVLSERDLDVIGDAARVEAALGRGRDGA